MIRNSGNSKLVSRTGPKLSLQRSPNFILISKISLSKQSNSLAIHHFLLLIPHLLLLIPTPKPSNPKLTNHPTGATAPILGYGALNGILFYTYNRSLTLLNDSPINPTSLSKIWTAGALGGFATFLVSAPTELIKCRAQVSSTHSRHQSLTRTAPSSPLSSMGIAREIVLRDGLRGLYFGGTITSIRDAVGYGFYFWSYEICNRILTSSHKDGEEESQKMAAAKVLLAGGIAGVITWASIFPLDVIKTRVQTQAFTSPAFPSPSSSPLSSPTSPSTANSRLLPSTSPEPEKFQRTSALQTAKTLYTTEGLRPFFRGLGICSVRAFIVNAVQWAVYEWMMKVLREPSKEPAHAV